MSHYISFGNFRFEPLTARLWQAEREIKLTRKAATVLGRLVDRAGNPVSKQELFASVWGKTVVTDDALVTCIQELRKALGDNAKQPRYIETRHRSGYLFVAKVAPSAQAPRIDKPVAPTEVTTAIAVLPFTDMSPGRDQDYFCEGLAEELINALTQFDGLRVAARSSSFHCQRAGMDVREVGQRLGVDAVLEGSVRKAGDQLRITVQLTNVSSGYHTCSRCFERNVGDVFAIQDEIAEAVAKCLRGRALSRRERHAVRRPQLAVEPYECFLRGRQYMHRMQQPDMDQSRRMFERAITLDESYAPAWAGLATVHALLFEWWGARDEDLQLADRASHKAIELAPDLADAHVARGLALTLHRCYEEAQTHFEAAIRINPHLFDAFYYYGRSAFAQGNVEHSVDLFRQASEVRQEDFQSCSLQGQSLAMLGRMDEAFAAKRECVVRAERILALNPYDGRALTLGSLALHATGEENRGMEWSRRSLELYPDDMSTLLNAACLRARAGLKEEAMELIQDVFSRGWGKRDWIENDPDYDCLRGDPRFQALFSKLK
jgi:adenylate cyclase